MSNNNGPKNVMTNPCSVCLGDGKPAPGMIDCICKGEGTAEAEIRNLRLLAEALRATFSQLQAFLSVKGYTCTKPSELMPAVEKLYERCTDAEDECVRMKRQKIR